MATEQMHDLAFELLDDGTIRLEQRDYCGESYVIDLHPRQLMHVAERVGLLPAPPMRDHLIADNDVGDEMHHLAVEMDDDGAIHLYQTQISGIGDSDEHVILHPAQAAWLGARLLFLTRPVKPLSGPSGATSPPSDDGCLSSTTGRAGGPSERDLFDEGATK